MTRQAVAVQYPTAPQGFSLLQEHDPEVGLNYFRVKFTATLEQSITDEMLGMMNLTMDEVWETVYTELENSLRRRFR